jgi:dolichol-phosphate mannosyltransferase
MLDNTTPNRSTQVVIAALNEEEGIGATIAEMSENLRGQRVLVIDGNSTDRTVEIAKDCGAEIALQDGIGKGDAIAKAIEYLDPQADYVVITDGDYTYPAEYVPLMVSILEKNPEVGMVCGNRFNDQAEENALQNKFYFGNKLLST